MRRPGFLEMHVLVTFLKCIFFVLGPGYIFFLHGISLGLVFLNRRRLPHPTDPVPTGSIGCSCCGPNQESHGLLCCSLVDQTGWLVTPRDLVGGIFSKSGVNYRIDISYN